MSLKAKKQHQRVRQQDEIFCPVCGCRWGVEDDAPPDCINTLNLVDATIESTEPDMSTVHHRKRYRVR